MVSELMKVAKRPPQTVKTDALGEVRLPRLRPLVIGSRTRRHC